MASMQPPKSKHYLTDHALILKALPLGCTVLSCDKHKQRFKTYQSGSGRGVSHYGGALEGNDAPYITTYPGKLARVIDKD